jgi:hypothetical protein
MKKAESKLIELIAKHPNLPIVAVISDDVANSYALTGEICKAYIERVAWTDDGYELESNKDKFCNFEVKLFGATYEQAEERFNALDWKEAIVFEVDV